jgi:hypothetical protein
MRQSGYFPEVECNKQAPLMQHQCPRVRIKRLYAESGGLPDWTPECWKACNLSSAQEELNSVCDDTVFPQTKKREERALADKIAYMTGGRSSLEMWARWAWPLVQKTTLIMDCVSDDMMRRFNSIGWPGSRNTGFDTLKVRYECRLHSCSANQCIKVTRTCPIPVMSAPPESMCAPFGDQNAYECVDKVPFSTWGMITTPIGYTFLAMSMICFMSASFACAQAACLRKSARVHPYAIADEVEEEAQACPECGEPLDDDAIEEGETICSDCALRKKEAEICRNCGAKYEDPEDMFCSECRHPRNQNDLAITDVALQPEDGAIAVRAEDSPLRATAQSAANEERIVPVDASGGMSPGMMGRE